MSRRQGQFQARLEVVAAVMLLLLVALGGRFFYLQVFKGGHYHTLAEANRIYLIPTPPPRGRIVDRNGVVLAADTQQYTLQVKLSDIQQTTAKLLEAVHQVVPLGEADRQRVLKKSDDERQGPVTLRYRLTDAELMRFIAHKHHFPGVEVSVQFLREYPYGAQTSHVLGYIGRIDRKDRQQLEAAGRFKLYRGLEHLGKQGIEKNMEATLHGIPGARQAEVDASGRVVRFLSNVAPVPGGDVHLNLDVRLHQLADRLLGTRRGAVVAIDPNNGQVLALLSKPGFDPAVFFNGLSSQDWRWLNSKADTPLINRALQGTYPPGSTIKPFMAYAALDSGKRKSSDSISDAGFFSLPGVSHQWRDWKTGGHGMVDLQKSITVSCDTYYYRLAFDMGPELLARQLGRFGFGKRTGIDADNENAGLLATPEWKQKRYRQNWYAGDTITMGIGQGMLLTTPLQMAQFTAMLAHEGKSFVPQLVKSVEGSAAVLPQRSLQLEPWNNEHWEVVRAGMVAVLKPGGTAAMAGAGADYGIAGKTGTAQVVALKQRGDQSHMFEYHRDHAWFIAFAPLDKPTIALAVLVENGGHGGAAAAPIARALFDCYLNNQCGAEPPASVPSAELQEAD